MENGADDPAAFGIDIARPEDLSCPRTIAERFGCGSPLLEFSPMHSGFQRFFGTAFYVVAFTAITRVQIPSGTPNRIRDISEDGKYVAQVSEEDCGALDSFHSSVQLWQDRQGLSARIFGKQRNATTVFTIGNDPRLIDLSWKDDRTLLIRYPGASRDPAGFRCQAQWGTIHIECTGYTPDPSKPIGVMPPVQGWVW